MTGGQFAQEQSTEEEAKKPNRRRLIIFIVGGVGVVCLLCTFAFSFLASSDDGEEIVVVTSAPTEVIDKELPPEETLLPSDTPEPTSTPRPTAKIFPTSTPSVADRLYEELVYILDKETILNVRISGRDLVIQTNLDRSNAEWFFDDLGTIHGVVVRENPDVDRTILKDTFGQQIIMPMDAMKSYYNHTIDWDTFRETWTIINPD